MRRFHVLVAAALLTGSTAPAMATARPVEWGTDRGPDPVATVADLKASRQAISPGRRGSSRVDLRFRSTTAQQLRISVLDPDGNEVRTVVAREIGEGAQQFAWDGRRADGSHLPDGSYELLVEAGTTSDTMSVSDVVVIDRRTPGFATPSRTVRLPSTSVRSFQLPVVATEPALLDIASSGSTGRARTASSTAGGRGSLTVPIGRTALLRRALARGGADVDVRIVATDAAGNIGIRRLRVRLLPPAPRVEPDPVADPAPTAGSSRLSWPLTGPITSPFGPRWGRMHTGIDVAVPTGRVIGAAGPGRVTYAGWMGGYGNTVMVDHGTLTTLYAHQSRIAVQSGSVLRRGQTLGYVGSTGNSTGPHLHFEVRADGSPRNPLHYLP